MATRVSKTTIALVGLIVLALAWRLFIITNSQISFYSDDAIYAAIARFWTQGKFKLIFHPTWPPLYPAISALTYLFVGNWENTLRIISAISGCLIAIPLFFLAKRILSTFPAYLFIITVLFISPLLRISLIPQSDMLATFLLTSSLTLMFFGFLDNSNKHFLWASFFLGLTYLTRAEGTLFFFLSLGYLTLWVFSRVAAKKKRGKSLFLIPIFILVFLTTISPYWIASRLQTGSWDLSSKSSAQIKQWHAFYLNKQGTTWIQEVVSIKHPNYKSDYFKGGLKYILEYQDWFWFWFKQKAVRWQGVFTSVFPKWSLPLIIAGLYPLVKRKYFWSFGFLISICLAAIPITIFATSISDIRYLAWGIPIFIFFMYSGVNVLLQIFNAQKFWFIWPASLLLITIAFPSFSLMSLFQINLYAQDITRNYYRREIPTVGQWIKVNSKDPEPKIMMKHEGVEFYADGTTLYIPQDITLDETLEYGKKHQADYLVAWTEELIADKNLSILLDAKFQNPHLKRVYQFPLESPIIFVYQFP